MSYGITTDKSLLNGIITKIIMKQRIWHNDDDDDDSNNNINNNNNRFLLSRYYF